MTLIVNEIHYDPSDPSRSRIISGADRRITAKGTKLPDRQKLFVVDRLNLTVSYFGLADASEHHSIETLLADFIASDTSGSIADFAAALKSRLDSDVDRALLRDYPSGFHTCGFTPAGVPQMWFITNIGGMNGFFHTNFRDHYDVPSEELSRRHLAPIFDEDSGKFIEPFGWSFQNGDLRTFADAWALLGEFAARMDAIGLTSTPTSPAEHEARFKWKMLTIGLYYDNVSYEQLVGGPIDTKVLLPDI